jgi:hypothetical protein
MILVIPLTLFSLLFEKEKKREKGRGVEDFGLILVR